MKKLFLKKTWLLFIAFAFSVVVIKGCEDNGTDSRSAPPHDPNSPVELVSFQPDSGRIRDQFLISGVNFGNDPSIVRVFFDDMDEALVLGAMGERILALVPRTNAGYVRVSVQVGDGPRQEIPGAFKYKVSRQVSTIAGIGGQRRNDFLGHGMLDRSILNPVYIGMDDEENIFVTLGSDAAYTGDADGNGDMLVLINEEENSIRVLLTAEQGFTHRTTPVIHPVTQQVLLGHEGVRDRFLILDREHDWAPTLMFIREWDLGENEDGTPKFTMPSGDVHHYCLLYCEEDRNFYTRYGNNTGAGHDGGHIVRICPETWTATVIGMTPRGRTYGMAFNTLPDKKWELWLAYDDNAEGGVAHSLATIDIRDEQRYIDVYPDATSHSFLDRPGEQDGRPINERFLQVMSSFQRRSAEGPGYRDGNLSTSMFRGPRQLSFDSSGILYVGDSQNHCIRRIDTRPASQDPPAEPIVSVFVGIPGVSGRTNGNEKDATFNNIHGIVLIETRNDDYMIIASDWGSCLIRKIVEE